MSKKQGMTEFINIIKSFRRRLNLASFLEYLITALLIGGIGGFLIQIAAFVIPVYYCNLYSAAALLLAGLPACMIAFFRRSTMERTALTIDGFGFEERIITAYENREKEGFFIERQRTDAIKCLNRDREKIKIPLCPDKRKLAGFFSLLALIIICSFVPSSVKKQAADLHKIRQQVAEKEEEIEEIMESLEELAQEELSPEELAALQDMIDSFRSSLSEYRQVATGEALDAANNRLDYKYSDIGSQLAKLAQSLQNGGNPSAASVEAMQSVSGQLQALSSNGNNGSQLASNNNGNNGGQNNGNSNGQGGGNGNENGQGSGNGNENGQGNGQGSGNGNENGQGSGNGNGNGQGSGNGNGQGSGSGGGRGTGSLATPHDYVSVPNAIADNESLTGSASGNYNSEYYRTQNGLAWEGNHVSYEAVIGNYQRNAYEGIAAGRYPTGMEKVIKDYFSSFN